MATTITKSNSNFSDFNMLMTKHPLTGDIVKKTDAEAIKASIRNLILTYNNEVPFHPEIGSRVGKLLFENWTPPMAVVLEKEIYAVIEQFEPRAQVMGLEIFDETDRNSLRIKLYFLIKNTSEPVTLNLLLERSR